MDPTELKSINIRPATINDCELIVFFIKVLGVYERATEKDMPVTAELIRTNIFQNKYGEVLIAELNKIPAGFCCFFQNFSSWTGKPGIWIEDIFVIPEYRKHGLGLRLFQEVAKICQERDCARLEWTCLNWNEPALEFYKKLGAQQMNDWIQHRMEIDGIKTLAEMKQ